MTKDVFIGAQFSFSYEIDNTLPSSSQPNYLYFKAFMNGRHAVSWGINLKLKDKLVGTISRALYEPSRRFHHNDNGVIIKREGIEARYFQFTPGPEEKSVAEDGGLIEFQVYRAKSRKRRVPELEEFRGHGNCGIK